MIAKRLVAVGECMGELRQRPDGALDLGFAGDTLNAAWYARRCLPPDWQVGFVSRIGDDPVSERMRAFMEAAGIDTRHLLTKPGTACGLYLITVEDGERRFTYWRQASAARGLADDPDALASALEGATAIHLSGITLAILSPVAREVLLTAIADARAAGSRVSFDTNLRAALWDSPAALRDWVGRAAAVADIVLPSFDEEAAAFGDADPAATAARYLNLGASLVAVKTGAGPVTLATGPGEVTEMPPPEIVTPIDTTAAGDSFAGGFLAAMLTGAAPEEAVRAGMALAARVVQGPGALVEV